MQRLLIIIFLLTNLTVKSQRTYLVSYTALDAKLDNVPSLQTTFTNQAQASNYIGKLQQLLQAKGFIAASVDSVLYGKDAATVFVFYGQQYQIQSVDVSSIPNTILQYNRINVSNNKIDIVDLFLIQDKLSAYYQNIGYPFAKVKLDNVQIENNNINAKLIVDTVTSYKIDSIRNLGKAKVKPFFLQKYLNIPAGSLFKKSTLDNISAKINQLPYVTEAQTYSLSMQSKSTVVNVYLQPKKSSVINVLLGVIPVPNPNGLTNAPQSKVFLSGDANILLNNTLHSGETIGLVYQQLSIKSRRVNLLFKYPYIFKSNYGIDTYFELYQRDSSFTNVDVNVGIRYQLDENKTGKIFIQQINTTSFPDTAIVRQTKKLPTNLDAKLSNIGLQFDWNTTNDFRVPTMGKQFVITGSVGRKNITKNSAITNLQSSTFNYATLYDSIKRNTYQIKINLNAAAYKLIKGKSVLKLGVQAGFIESANYLRNELFQIGGFKILRGFDEESQFCNQYIVPTVEWRYLLSGASYFYGFVDGGYTLSKVAKSIQHAYVGTGLGLSFTTKSGVFNLSAAVGARDDIPLTLKQSKLHFGYVSVF